MTKDELLDSFVEWLEDIDMTNKSISYSKSNSKGTDWGDQASFNANVYLAHPREESED